MAREPASNLIFVVARYRRTALIARETRTRRNGEGTKRWETAARSVQVHAAAYNRTRARVCTSVQISLRANDACVHVSTDAHTRKNLDA